MSAARLALGSGCHVDSRRQAGKNLRASLAKPPTLSEQRNHGFSHKLLLLLLLLLFLFLLLLLLLCARN